MPKGLVPIAPLRRGLFVLGGDGKMGKVKRWERWKGEKVKKWLRPLKVERRERWKGERVKKWLRPLRVERWKGGKKGKVKRWKSEKVKKWLRPLKMKRWKDEKMKRWKIERMLDNEQFGLNTNGALACSPSFSQKGTLNIRKLLARRLYSRYQRKIIVTLCFCNLYGQTELLLENCC